MKNRIISVVVGILLLCASFGLTACGEGYANYFNVIKDPKNFKIEYICGGDSFTEIRVGSKVALKTTWDGSNSISKDTEWTIYANKYKEQSNLFYASQFARYTSSYRQSFEKSGSAWEKSESTFLGRVVIVYLERGISGYVAGEGSEPIDREYTNRYVVDKEYDIVLARYYAWDGDDEQTDFEVTLFEVGGQEIPDNPELPLN